MGLEVGAEGAPQTIPLPPAGFGTVKTRPREREREEASKAEALFLVNVLKMVASKFVVEFVS